METIEQETIATSTDFFEKISKRRSIRQFSDQPVAREILLNAIRSAGTAPSGANRQPWHFALVTSQDIKNRIRVAAEQVEHEFYNGRASEQWLEDLKPFGTNSSKPYLSQAPALIAVFSKTTSGFEEIGMQRVYYPVESTGIAVGFLLTALHNAGVSTLTHTPRPMNFLNQVLGFDKSFKPFMIIVVGYPAPALSIPPIPKKSICQIMSEH